MAGAPLSVNEIEKDLKNILLKPQTNDKPGGSSGGLVPGKANVKKQIYQPPHRRERPRDSPITEDRSVISYESTSISKTPNNSAGLNSRKPLNIPVDLQNHLQQTQKKRPRKKKKKPDDAEAGSRKDVPSKSQVTSDGQDKQAVGQRKETKTNVKGKQEINQTEEKLEVGKLG